MIPIAIYETLTEDQTLQNYGITTERVLELQSIDERPFDDGCFVVINWQESSGFGLMNGAIQNTVQKPPRTMMIWVHSPSDRSRDYRILDRILNRIDELLLPIEHKLGSDDIRVSCVVKQGRSGNLTDDGWKTISRNATYGVLYDEYMA